MKLPRIRITELVPIPCVHGTHAHFSEMLACVEENGIPGAANSLPGFIEREISLT